MIWRNLFRLSLLPLLMLSALARAETPSNKGIEDSIGPAMAGEFAFQSGHYIEAARHTLLAAQRSPDIGLVERATRFAVLSGDSDLLAQALRRWKQLAANDPVRAGFALRLALRQDQPSVAAAEAGLLLSLGKVGQDILQSSLEQAHGAAAEVARRMLRELVANERLSLDFEAALALVAIADRANEKASVRQWLMRLPAMFPAEPRALLALAGWQREQGEEAAALLTLARLLPALVERDADRRQAANEYLELQQYAQAERWLSAVAPDAALYRQRLALLARAKNDRDQYEAVIGGVIKQIRADRSLSAARRSLLLGLAAELGPDWREAERRYRDVRNGVERSEAQLRLAYVLQMQDRIDDALRILRKLQRDTEVSAETRRDAFSLEARLLLKPGNDADLDAYERGLAVFKDDSRLLYGRAMRNIDGGRIDAGLADLRRIIDSEADNAAALNAYGYTLASSKQEYSLAAPHVERALRLQPDSPAILDSLGYIRYKLGQLGEALPLLQRAWKLQPDPEIAAHLGELLWLMGRKDEAGNLWQEGMKLAPGNALIRSLQEKYQP